MDKFNEDLKNEVTSLIRAYDPTHARAGAGDDYAVRSITIKVKENLLESVKKHGPKYWTEDEQKTIVDAIKISRDEILHEVNLIRKEG
jgi:hypothetical protein